VASLRLQIDDEALYEGPAIAVPRVGEDIHHDGEIVRIQAVVWDFGRTDDIVSVTLLVGRVPYTV
jgi:hypothetical protein